jgi:hypothetical protein
LTCAGPSGLDEHERTFVGRHDRRDLARATRAGAGVAAIAACAAWIFGQVGVHPLKPRRLGHRASESTGSA